MEVGIRIQIALLHGGPALSPKLILTSQIRPVYMVLIHLQTAYNDLRLADMLHVDGYEPR
jgi:hypothetical protein